MDIGATLGSVPQGRAIGYQSSAALGCTSVSDGCAPSSNPGAPNTAAAMMFPGQSGPMPTLPDLTGRGQSSASPRGARGIFLFGDHIVILDFKRSCMKSQFVLLPICSGVAHAIILSYFFSL